MCSSWSIELRDPRRYGVTPNIPSPFRRRRRITPTIPSALVTFTATVVDPTGAGIPTGTVTTLDSANYDMLTPDATLISSGSAASGSSATFDS